jgi:hypothetical protein
MGERSAPLHRLQFGHVYQLLLGGEKRRCAESCAKAGFEFDGSRIADTRQGAVNHGQWGSVVIQRKW